MKTLQQLLEESEKEIDKKIPTIYKYNNNEFAFETDITKLHEEIKEIMKSQLERAYQLGMKEQFEISQRCVKKLLSAMEKNE